MAARSWIPPGCYSVDVRAVDCAGGGDELTLRSAVLKNQGENVGGVEKGFFKGVAFGKNFPLEIGKVYQKAPSSTGVSIAGYSVFTVSSSDVVLTTIRPKSTRPSRSTVTRRFPRFSPLFPQLTPIKPQATSQRPRKQPNTPQRIGIDLSSQL